MSHSPFTPKVGHINRLTIEQQTSRGLMLAGNVFLPNRAIPEDLVVTIGEPLEVFVYVDNQEELIATTDKPYTEVGKFADLQVVEVASFGYFLDWGLPKDLLLPFRESLVDLEVDDFVIVYTYIDPVTQKITATTKYERHVQATAPHYKTGDKVSVLVESKTPLGLKVIVDHAYWGVVYQSDIVGEMHIGDEFTGYIKPVREDGKLDVSMIPIIKTNEARHGLEGAILKALKANKEGRLPVSDKSDPDVIMSHFGVSKAAFKRAIGALYKNKKIIIHKDAIELQK
ncbi:CvfB family protein [Wohlfahrtiimonas chitiniclastica]|uniref:CvfB family protein n=1 Tax=Wohlfahrtiimonas chitiniclastica TaxID=400946 RepID=UPI001BCCA121|nr:S1-like domain-containing RNA-binding protein [Wohlfahrtiimonas chitiniclastica]MBS7835593.1 hypothetical protein [Wohlfahrtiimonas chitiniclastica]